jgi:predicted lipoprotein with Yx(FWY)xxD motif
MKRIALGLAALIVSAAAAFAADPAMVMDSSAGKIWTDQNGMTLYTFDTDGKGAMKSACTGKCIENWPPLLAADGATASGDWTLVEVVDKDGATKKMWAYEGWPLYLFVGDTKPGDVSGDGKGGVWHVAKAE